MPGWLAVPKDWIASLGDIVKFYMRVFGEIFSWQSRLDVLVNNAGVAMLKPLMEVSLSELNRLIEVNVTGTLLCTQAAVRHMQRARYGRVVNIGSVAGQRGIVGRGAYGATKAAVHALTQVLVGHTSMHVGQITVWRKAMSLPAMTRAFE